MEPLAIKPLWADFRYMEHQEIGVRWLLAREAAGAGAGGILADDMGLGKTIQMTGLLKNSTIRPREESLLIAPVAVLEQWKTVIRRAGLTVLVPRKGNSSWTIEGAFRPLAHRVHVIGYEAAARNHALLTAFRWDRVIYDEAHRIASDNRGTAVARLLQSGHNWMLTGTPIVNKLTDLTTLLELVGAPVPPYTTLERLRPLLKTYILCRTMEQLRATIPGAPPAPIINHVNLDFDTEDEAEFYKGMSGLLTRRWKAIEADRGAGAAIERLRLFMRLRQLSLHPQIYIGARKRELGALYSRADWPTASTKFRAIRELIAKQPKTHKWIVFCHFRDEMEMLRTELRTAPNVARVQIYNGGMTAAEKSLVVEASKGGLAEGKQEVLLVQLQSGGVGLNLQHFDRIIFSGPWWTKALMEQAVARAVRIGQTKVVEVFHMRLKEEEALNIDEYMSEKADGKGKLCREVLAESNTAINAAAAVETARVAVAAVQVIDLSRSRSNSDALSVPSDSDDEEDPGDPTGECL